MSGEGLFPPREYGSLDRRRLAYQEAGSAKGTQETCANTYQRKQGGLGTGFTRRGVGQTGGVRRAKYERLGVARRSRRMNGGQGVHDIRSDTIKVERQDKK